MTPKKRLHFPDSVKGLAVLLMIQVHLMEVFAKEEILNSTLGKISLFLGGVPAAPVFMVMMGYFLAFGRKNPSSMAKRGLRLFMGGILLNIGLNANLLIKIFFEDWLFNPWHFILGVDILPLAGLSLIVLALIQRFLADKYWVYFLLATAIAMASQLTEPLQFENHPMNYILAFLVGGTSWSYFPLIPWLAYPLLGYGFKLVTDQYRIDTLLDTIWSKIGIGIIGIALLITAKFGFDISTNLPSYYHHNFPFFIWSAAFISFWVYALFLLNKIGKNSVLSIYLQFLGRNVTAVYVFQWLLIGNLGTALYKSQNSLEWAFWFLNICIISSILTYLWVEYKTKFKLQK